MASRMLSSIVFLLSVGYISGLLVPADLKYTPSHEWVWINEDEGNIGTVGITEYAQEKLGETVYVELPNVGRAVSQGEKCGAIDGVITTMDFNSPLSGKVLQVNNELSQSPELVNAEPYTEGWIMKLELSDAGELDKLMDSDQYSKFCEEEDAKQSE